MWNVYIPKQNYFLLVWAALPRSKKRSFWDSRVTTNNLCYTFYSGFFSHSIQELCSYIESPKNVEIKSGSHLLSQVVSNQVSSAVLVLTIVFGMGTGVSPKRIATGSILLFPKLPLSQALPARVPSSRPMHPENDHLLWTFPFNDLFLFFLRSSRWQLNNKTTFTSSSLERRWSSRTFRYGYLVTTSPQLSVPPSAAPSLRLGHWLRALLTPMVWRAVCTRPGNVFTVTFWFTITSDSSFM